MTHPTRRTFLASAALAAYFANPARPMDGTKVRVAVMGTGGRGTELGRLHAALPGVQVATVCDVDAGRMKAAAEAVAAVSKKHDSPDPKTATDLSWTTRRWTG
jgi:predicted homoserine dehydrogenase-like protein